MIIIFNLVGKPKQGHNVTRTSYRYNVLATLCVHWDIFHSILKLQADCPCVCMIRIRQKTDSIRKQGALRIFIYGVYTNIIKVNFLEHIDWDFSRFDQSNNNTAFGYSTLESSEHTHTTENRGSSARL